MIDSKVISTGTKASELASKFQNSKSSEVGANLMNSQPGEIIKKTVSSPTYKATIRSAKLMKNSGIEWIGQIPENWDTSKIIYQLSNIGSGTTPQGDHCYEGNIFWLNTGDLNNTYIHSTKKTVTQTAIENYSTLKIYPQGSVVIAMYGATIGKLGILAECMATNQACCVMLPNDTLNNKFLFYALYAGKEYILSISEGAGQPNINQNDVKIFPIPYVRDIDEQKKIVDYLDDKCGKIDQAIEGQKKIIEKLKEYKQSVITEAVTKGLDPNVPMKDSGIEWIGQIPEHWKLSKVFFFYNIQLGKMLQPIQKSDSDVERKYLCALNVGNNTFKNETNKTMWFSPEELELYSVKNGDLLVVEGGDVASSAFVKNLDEDVCFQNALHRVRPIGKNSLKYLRYLLISAKSSGYINLICNKATIAHFSKEKFISMPYIVMSFQEQIAISEFLDEKCLKIDEAIQKKEETIEKLTEYKKSLIYECVTGKKEIV